MKYDKILQRDLYLLGLGSGDCMGSALIRIVYRSESLR